jgi:hypothetical protein
MAHATPGCDADPRAFPCALSRRRVDAVWIPAFAQQGAAELRGAFVDQQQAVLPGVSITIRNQDTGMFRETISNADGSYFVAGVRRKRPW